MITEKETTTISKFLSLVLRHEPETIGIALDSNGWADVAELISKINSHGLKLDMEVLQYVVANNNKKRFAFNDDLDKIRASQGHSVQIDLGYVAQPPPDVLYHGTATKNIASILQTGINKRERNHVHLSDNIETATKVGQRHGAEFIFEVNARQMHQDNFEFYLSANGVWLTDHVPSRYLGEYKN